MGRYTEISEDEIIASAKMMLRIQNTTEFDDFFSLMINEGVRHLSTISIFKKQQCELRIEDQKAKLPKGFYRLLGARFKSTDINDQSKSNCMTLFYVDKKFLNDCGCNTTLGSLEDFNQSFQIQNGYMFFNSNINADFITLAYMGLNLDENGKIKIYDDYERALRAYACYKFCLSFSDDYKEATIQRYKDEWVAQKQWVRGTDQQNFFQNDKSEIQSVFNALILSPLVNW